MVQVTEIICTFLWASMHVRIDRERERERRLQANFDHFSPTPATLHRMFPFQHQVEEE